MRGRPSYWVLDTGALMAYAHGAETVGQRLVHVSEAEGVALIPTVCLLEAYSLLDYDETEMLRVLRGLPAVETVAPAIDVAKADDCPHIGGMARRAGRLGAGHAAFVALTSAAGVVTSRPDQIRTLLGEEWIVEEV